MANLNLLIIYESFNQSFNQFIYLFIFQEMKHFESIQQKIIQMEKKHETRELELQQVVKNAKHSATVELDQEVNKWKGIVDSKNNEIQRFRTELDAILDILKLLQKQGVVIPVSSAVL